ncbi:MAG: hypothetical protein V1897_08175, partial [Pseudomonadota bacterium]
MARSKKLLLGALAAFVITVIGLALTARFIPESDFVRQTIESKISKETGRQVSLGQVRIRIGFPSLVNVLVENTSISDDKGNSLFSVREIRLNPSFWSILTGQPAIENLTISEATVVMYRDSSGHIESLLSRKPSAASQFVIADEEQRSGQTEETIPGKLEKPQFSWPIKYVLIESSRVILEDASAPVGEPVKLSLEKINGQINRDGASISFHLTGIPAIPGIQSAELVTKGSFLFNDNFTILETGQVVCNLDSAK